ncbi:type II toxin-antitoxin system RelE/ParE family toxin [Lewinella sp. 4G2]|uniref:type II toxin-antitoxin system RelE/ParE family toxin n=1 Tax=Lewinella sp. 4G2 TaxID=1803372 RepID=UPI0007B4AA13|nr:type II toxin-antitoxin system RelE/ParE family toxin [Lewinella sp. 4G2]OAV43953.1 hypothetical protein A3850_005350 [Lewinella sp. 4G2]
MAGTYTVTVTPSAIADLQEALNYIAENQSLTSANSIQDEILNAIERLEKMPESHPPVRETHDVVGTKYRRIIAGNYRIIYQVDELRPEVFVIRILHVKRGPDFVRGALL